MSQSQHHRKTRRIYEKQHARICADADARQRIDGMYESATMGLPREWFKGKDALDAGCGNIGSLIRRLSRLGAERVYGIDVGNGWIEKLQASLKRAGVPSRCFELRPGSILDIPFPTGRFDFVAINGVLIHLRNTAEILHGFREGARVCKSGGYYFTSYGPCGGLIQGTIFPAIRERYRQDAKFKNFIDGIHPKVIHKAIDRIVSLAKERTGEDLRAGFLKSLFGEDFCVFLQNYIQAPVWLSNECTPEFVEEMYKANGFTEITRLNSFVKRKDVRKFFAPLHFDRDEPLSQILYGKGYVQFIGRKA